MTFALKIKGVVIVKKKMSASNSIPALIYEDNHCVVFDKKFSPRAPVHFLVVPKKRIPYFYDPSGDDEKLLGHLLKVARKVAIDKGLKNSFNIIVDEDMKTSKFKCLHIYGNCHHNMRPNTLFSRL